MEPWIKLACLELAHAMLPVPTIFRVDEAKMAALLSLEPQSLLPDQVSPAIGARASEVYPDRLKLVIDPSLCTDCRWSSLWRCKSINGKPTYKGLRWHSNTLKFCKTSLHYDMKRCSWSLLRCDCRADWLYLNVSTAVLDTSDINFVGTQVWARANAMHGEQVTVQQLDALKW